MSRFIIVPILSDSLRLHRHLLGVSDCVLPDRHIDRLESWFNGHFVWGLGNGPWANSSAVWSFIIARVVAVHWWIDCGARRYLNSVSQLYGKQCRYLKLNKLVNPPVRRGRVWIGAKINTNSVCSRSEQETMLENNLFGIQRGDDDGNLCVKFKYFYHQTNSCYRHTEDHHEGRHRQRLTNPSQFLRYLHDLLPHLVASSSWSSSLLDGQLVDDEPPPCGLVEELPVDWRCLQMGQPKNVLLLQYIFFWAYNKIGEPEWDDL